MRLYELSALIAGVDSMLELCKAEGEAIDGDGVVYTEEDLQRQRTDLFARGSEVLDECAKARKNHEAEADALEQEAARLMARSKRARSKADWHKETIRAYMDACGLTKVKGDLFSFSLGRPMTRVEVAEGVTLPAEFLHPPKPPAPDLAKIKAALEAGQSVPGAQFVEGTRPLRIT